VSPFPTVQAAELATAPPEDRWLVRDLWTRTGVGIIGGQPKLGKSWLALDIAVSIASGTPCLDHYPVDVTGPVLLFLAEDPEPDLRRRLDALCAHRRLTLSALPLRVLQIPVLRLDEPDHLERLAATIEAGRPRLVVLDPLIRLHRLDENASADMARLLGALRELQRRFDVAVVLVHHASKRSRQRPGQALRGSSDLHAFVDCLLYLARERDVLQLHLEHRSVASPEPVELRLVKGDAPHLELVSAPVAAAATVTPLPQRVLDCLRGAAGPLRRKDLRTTLRVNNQRLGEALAHLERQGQIGRGDERIRLADVSQGQLL